MDRKMFDMSEFYKGSGRIAEVADYDARMMRSTPGKDSECEDPLTMVFINMQPLDSVYSLDEAFCNGTLFPNLNKPFFGGMSR